MGRWIVLFFVLSLFSANGAYAQFEGGLPLDPGPVKEKLLKAAIKTSLRLLIDFDFTAILVEPDDRQVSNKSLSKRSDDARLEFPVSLPAKGIIKLKTAGIFDFKLKWDLHTRGLGTVTGAHIHCKNLLGNDGGVGVTLQPKGLFKDNWRNQHGTIKAPDEGNECGWVDMLDVFVAMELNRAFVSIHTEENPDGEIAGDIANIGF